MKKLPIDVSDFQTLISNDYVYVDKTRQIYNLITQGRLYFLSRPRRFGKTLLISTLKEIFLGHKKLFSSLWIGKSNYTWLQHPVIHLNFSLISHKSADSLMADLVWRLEDIAKKNTISIADAPSLETKLHSLISQLSETNQNKVVVLVDEYDYPLLRNLDSLQVAAEIRDVLSSFFASIKALDDYGYIRTIFITGVTKFSKTSIFSGMNNLNDISLDLEVATLLGYTKEEIDTYFKEEISNFAKNQKLKESSIKKNMEAWYNGYKFTGSPYGQKVYNPFSILYYLQKQQQKNYWFEVGTPSFLIDLLKSQSQLPEQIERLDDNVIVGESSLGAFDLNTKLPLYTLLFQTGYLTIKSYNSTLQSYKLGYPNEEVRLSLSTYLMAILVHKDKESINAGIFAIRSAIDTNNLELFCSYFQNLLSGIPYNLYGKNEAYFHSMFHVFTTLLGLDVHSEIHTSVGRIDLILTTKKRIYIFEFKFNKSGQEALQQIKNNRYYEKYLESQKPITLAGISFNFDDKQFVLDKVIEDLNMQKKQ